MRVITFIIQWELLILILEIFYWVKKKRKYFHL